MTDREKGARLEFHKYTGAANAFILFDSRFAALPDDPETLARGLCRRGHSIGADGFITVDKPELGDPSRMAVRMRVWNADGSLVSLSANGACCVARYLVDEGYPVPELVIGTDGGLVSARLEGDRIWTRLPFTAEVEPGRRLRLDDRDVAGTFVEAGGPFFVCVEDDPEAVPVGTLGRAICGHPDLGPDGASAVFVRVDGEDRLSYRVYKRGVEAETLSSGTGSLAAALAAAAAGKVRSPVVCDATGGALTVRFRREDAPAGGGETADEISSAGTVNGGRLAFAELEVEGRGRRICRGEAFPDAWSAAS